MREKFKEAEIFTLIAKVKLTKAERIIDWVLVIAANCIFGIPDIINGMKNLDKEFYLVNQDDKQYLVVVTNEFLERRRLPRVYSEKSFEIGDRKYINCGLIREKS